MNTEAIQNTINTVETKISNIKMMVDDYNGCKSEMSKRVLEATITKLLKPFDVIVGEHESQRT